MVAAASRHVGAHRREAAWFAACLAGLAVLLAAGPARADSLKPIACKASPLPPAFPEQTEAFPPSETVTHAVRTVAWGLVHPWALLFLPDGRFLVTERPGRMRVVSPDGALSAPLAGLPVKAGERLLDVVAAPDFATSRLIYFNYGESRADGNGMTVARARLSQDSRRLEDVTTIFRMGPSQPTHAVAGRLLWGADGKLYITVSTGADENERFTIARDDPRIGGRAPGGAGLPPFADSQSLTADTGKVIRLNPDGSVPRDNPFVQVPGARGEIFAVGIRDAQGLAFDPATGALWEIEHGPQGGDELNVIKPGHNYGWPIITYGCDYEGNAIGTAAGARAGMDAPVYFWRPSIAPSGLLFYNGSLFPQWKGNLFVGAMAGRHVSRLVLDKGKVVAEEALLEDEHDRIRALYQAPDGSIYVLTDEDAGRLLQIYREKGE